MEADDVGSHSSLGIPALQGDSPNNGIDVPLARVTHSQHNQDICLCSSSPLVWHGAPPQEDRGLALSPSTVNVTLSI